jgi:hypothetical protein
MTKLLNTKVKKIVVTMLLIVAIGIGILLLNNKNYDFSNNKERSFVPTKSFEETISVVKRVTKDDPLSPSTGEEFLNSGTEGKNFNKSTNEYYSILRVNKSDFQNISKAGFEQQFFSLDGTLQKIATLDMIEGSYDVALEVATLIKTLEDTSSVAKKIPKAEYASFSKINYFTREGQLAKTKARLESEALISSECKQMNDPASGNPYNNIFQLIRNGNIETFSKPELTSTTPFTLEEYKSCVAALENKRVDEYEGEEVTIFNNNFTLYNKRVQENINKAKQ